MNRILMLGTIYFALLSSSFGQNSSVKNWYEFDKNSSPRWSSFENRDAAKGRAAMENNGAKGHPSDGLDAGESKVLLNVKTQGIINRIWITINDRSPEMLRSLKLEMFWDNASEPAVSVPFGDFFGMGLGQTASYHNALFANPEGRSFLCLVPMPFKKAARIQLTNESSKRLSHVFYDIDFQELSAWNADYLYFHAFWQRDTATTLGRDFELLPAIKGRGRFLGVNISVNANPVYKNYWWGEGEIKIYLDGDRSYPTLASTGTEDYIGTAWSQGEFFNDYSGCLLANKDSMGWAFYRYHIPDPVYFKTDCRVTMQQIGGNRKELVADLQGKGVPLIPVGLDDTRNPVHPLYKKGFSADLKDPTLPDGFANFYRSDDVSATAYFYLGEPSSGLPPLQPLSTRIFHLKTK
jgi:hypothetical protein